MRVPRTKAAGLPLLTRKKTNTQNNHAFFVYLELSHYYERVLAARPRDKVAAQKRLVEILLGLRASLADFTNNPGFTPSGRELFIALSGDVAALLDRHRKLMAS